MTLNVFRKIIGGILLVSLIAIGFSNPFQEYLHIPNKITLFEGQHFEMAKAKMVSAELSLNSESIALKEDTHSISLVQNVVVLSTSSCLPKREEQL